MKPYLLPAAWFFLACGFAPDLLAIDQQTLGIGRTKPPVLDGKLDDWPQDASRIVLGRAADTAPRPGKWEGTPDLSGVIRLAWDDSYLYLAGDIADDKVLQAQPAGAEPWEGDTLELFLNIHPGPQRQGGFWQIALIPPLTPGGKFAVACPQGEFPDVEGAAEVHPGGYTFECRIPWKNLAGFHPAIDARLGVQLILNDRDSKGRKSLLCWYPSAITFVHPTDVNIVELREAGAPSVPDLVAGAPAQTVTTPGKVPVSVLTTITRAKAARVRGRDAGQEVTFPLNEAGAGLAVGKGALLSDAPDGEVAFSVELLDATDSVVGHGEFKTELAGHGYTEVRERADAIGKKMKSEALLAADPEALAGLEFWHHRIVALLQNEARPESVSGSMIRQMLVELHAMDSALNRLETGKDPYANLSGSFVRAYRSPLTGSFRPHALYLPPGFDHAKKYPLIVILHGIFADERELFRMAEDFRGCDAIIYQAASYRQFDWADLSAAETWKGLEDILAKYPVDRDHISLIGWHIGGRGALQLAMARPGFFAAIAALYPGIDARPPYPALRLYPQFYQKAAADNLIPFPHEKILPPPEAITDPLERKIYERVSLASRAENLIGLPVHLTDGEANRDAAAERSALTARLAELGAPVETRYVAGALHGNQPPELSNREVFDWLLAQRRPNTPEAFSFVVTNLRDNTAWSARVDALASDLEPGRVRIVRHGSALSITTSGVEALSPMILPEKSESEPLRITIDGQEVAPIPAAEVSGVTLVRDSAGRWSRGTVDPTRKHQGQSGPLDDAQFDRFIYVYGTQGSEIETAALEKTAKKLANRGLGAEFPVKADRDLTSDEIGSFHLLLVGTPANNSLLQKVAPSLPLAWKADGLQLGSNSVSGEGAGACVIYPNPLAPDRYVLVLTGTDEKAIQAAWSQRAGVDYVLVQGGGEDKRVARGLFDRNWKFSDKLNLPLREPVEAAK